LSTEEEDLSNLLAAIVVTSRTTITNALKSTITAIEAVAVEVVFTTETAVT